MTPSPVTKFALDSKGEFSSLYMNAHEYFCLKDTKYKLHNMFGIMAAILERSSWLSVAKLKPLINSLAIRLLSQSQTEVKPTEAKAKPSNFL